MASRRRALSVDEVINQVSLDSDSNDGQECTPLSIEEAIIDQFNPLGGSIDNITRLLWRI